MQFFVKKQVSDKANSIFDYFFFCASSIMTLCFIVTFFFQVHRVDGTSMSPTLSDNQLVCLYPFKYQEISNNDIVAIAVEDTDVLIVKRVFAIGGDELLYDEVNKTITNLSTKITHPDPNLGETRPIEPFEWQKITGSENLLSSFIVLESDYVVFGDNFNLSQDSRYYGTFCRDEILGRILFYD
jgi:signal peptidase I